MNSCYSYYGQLGPFWARKLAHELRGSGFCQCPRIRRTAPIFRILELPPFSGGKTKKWPVVCERWKRKSWSKLQNIHSLFLKNSCIIFSLALCYCSAGIATGYGLDSSGIESRLGSEIFPTCPDRL